MTRPPDVTVVGAGVSGLTTAICLARGGMRVTVVAERPPLETTSAVAGAVWGPTGGDERIIGWSTRTWHVLHDLAQDRDGCGVRMAHGMEAAHVETPPPPWVVELGDWTTAADGDVPAGYATAWRYRAPVVEMRTYIGFLLRELDDLGVALTSAKLAALTEAKTPAVVNCSGLGARELVPDPEVYPVKGQLVLVRNPGLDGFFVDDRDPESEESTYFMTHDEYVVLGGSSHRDVEDLTADRDVAAAIVARCTAVEPRLAGAVVQGQRVGLRPVRGRVRLEHEARDGIDVVHNYGHGGAGLTMSWGCAFAVRDLLGAR